MFDATNRCFSAGCGLLNGNGLNDGADIGVRLTIIIVWTLEWIDRWRRYRHKWCSRVLLAQQRRRDLPNDVFGDDKSGQSLPLLLMLMPIQCDGVEHWQYHDEDDNNDGNGGYVCNWSSDINGRWLTNYDFHVRGLLLALNLQGRHTHWIKLKMNWKATVWMEWCYPHPTCGIHADSQLGRWKIGACSRDSTKQQKFSEWNPFFSFILIWKKKSYLGSSSQRKMRIIIIIYHRWSSPLFFTALSFIAFDVEYKYWIW